MAGRLPQANAGRFDATDKTGHNAYLFGCKLFALVGVLRIDLILRPSARGTEIAVYSSTRSSVTLYAFPAHQSEVRTMAKVLKCKDVVPGCKTILEGRDEVDVVVKEAEHVRVAHKMKRIPGTLLAQLTAAVADRVELGY